MIDMVMVIVAVIWTIILIGIFLIGVAIDKLVSKIFDKIESERKNDKRIRSNDNTR